MLGYERLDVYQRAIEHLTFVFRSIPKIPRGYSALVDQWRRAAMSVPLNIAEAVGKKSDPDRSHRYAIARGEAMESMSSGFFASCPRQSSPKRNSCSSESWEC
jgi:four helix bundle protein